MFHNMKQNNYNKICFFSLLRNIKMEGAVLITRGSRHLERYICNL